MDEMVTFGRFRLDSSDKDHPSDKSNALLHSTQYADIYRGVDTVLKRAVMLRVFKPEWMKEQRLRSHLVQSLQRSAELVHPHIAWVWDIGEEAGQIFSAERFVEGALLEDVLLAEHRLPWEKAYTVFRQIAQALEFAHEHNVFHGDLTLNQISISPEHGAIVEGFGLRQVFAMSENGSLEAPINRQSDQQALAKLLIEMVAGQVPRPSDSPFPAHWPLGIPRLIEEPLRRALGLHPAGPFVNMNEFVIAILEKASQPQPALSMEELALLQAEEDAEQAAKEAERKAAEEAIRQLALEDARREINEQFQKGIEERVFLDVAESDAEQEHTVEPVNLQDEVLTPETGPESVSQREVFSAATDLSTQSTSDENAEKTKNEQVLTEAETGSQDTIKPTPPVEAPSVPSSSQKKRSRRRVLIFMLLILIILLISSLVWAYLNGFIGLPYRL
jgi:serine/threonine protein kinase